MAALSSRVPCYTIKLIALEVATIPELWWWSRVSWRHGRSMPEILTLGVLMMRVKLEFN